MDVIVLKDGSKFVMSSFKDLIDLIRIYIGDDAVSWLSTYIYDSKCSAEEKFYIGQEDEVDEVEATKAHYKFILQDIHDLTGELSKEIREKKLNRDKVSNLVGKIAILAYRNY